MRYLIAYDISHPRRLRRVARALSKLALRCQKSVFLLTEKSLPLAMVLDRVRPLIDPDADLLQAWALAHPVGDPVCTLGTPSYLEGAVAVVGPGGEVSLSGKPHARQKKRHNAKSIQSTFME